MSIVSSSFDAGDAQADGRRNITERHTASDGHVYEYTYLADVGIDCALVLSERAAMIDAQLAARQAALALVVGTTLPLTAYEWLSRMTPTERVAIRALAQTDPITNDFLQLLNVAGVVHPTNPDVQGGLAYLVYKGCLTTERAAIIGAAA